MSMTLAAWRQRRQRAGETLTLQAIAKAVGLKSPETVRRHLEGLTRPRAETIAAYHRFTKGKVDVAAWYRPQQPAARS